MKTGLVVVAAVGLLSLTAGAESLCAAFDRKTGLSGSEYWAGLKRHPAVVNPVEKDPVIVGEGCRDAYAYLAVRTLPNGRRHVFVSGLDITSKTTEGQALRRSILRCLSDERE